jgi:hypothetical protein
MLRCFTMNLTAAGNEAIPDDRSETHFPAEIMTAEDVARYLHCSKAHVYNAINGKIPNVPPLPAVCLGRRRLVRHPSLDLWIAINENGPASGMMPILQGRNDDRESRVRQIVEQHKPIRAHEYKATARPSFKAQSSST